MIHQITIPVYGWERWTEIVEYACAHNIDDLADAIKILTDKGLDAEINGQ